MIETLALAFFMPLPVLTQYARKRKSNLITPPHPKKKKIPKRKSERERGEGTMKIVAYLNFVK